MNREKQSVTCLWRTDAKADPSHRPRRARRGEDKAKPGYWALRRRVKVDGRWRSRGYLKVTPELAEEVGYEDFPEVVTEFVAMEVCLRYQGRRNRVDPIELTKVPVEKLTVEGAFELFFTWCEGRALRGRLTAHHVGSLRRSLFGGTRSDCRWPGVLEFLPPNQNVHTVGRRDIQRVWNAIDDTYTNGGSSTEVWAAVCRVFRWLHSQLIIETNPTSGFEWFKAEPCEPHPLPVDFVARILAAARVSNEPLFRFLVAMYATGMRPVQLRRLKWTDVDLEGKPPLINGPKAKGLPRFDALCPVVLQSVLRSMARESEFVFVHPGRGGGLERTWLQYQLWKFRRAHPELAAHPGNHPDHPQWTPYDLRDTFATTLREGGVSIDDVTALVGDKNVRTVQARYARNEMRARIRGQHLRPVRGVEHAAAVLDDALRDAGFESGALHLVVGA